MAEYIKLAKTTTEFQNIKDSDPTLPIIATCSVTKENYSNSAERIVKKIDDSFGGIAGTPTQSTNYVEQLDTILAPYSAYDDGSEESTGSTGSKE